MSSGVLGDPGTPPGSGVHCSSASMRCLCFEQEARRARHLEVPDVYVPGTCPPGPPAMSRCPDYVRRGPLSVGATRTSAAMVRCPGTGTDSMSTRPCWTGVAPFCGARRRATCPAGPAGPRGDVVGWTTARQGFETPRPGSVECRAGPTGAVVPEFDSRMDLHPNDVHVDWGQLVADGFAC